jgi:hypothetical protein
MSECWESGNIQILIKESCGTSLMHTIGRIPRWLVERDPSWEMHVNPLNGMFEWTRKGTEVQATCDPAGFFCDVSVKTPKQHSDLMEIFSRFQDKSKAYGPSDLTKYLSSRYLNPTFDTDRMRHYKFQRS